ncbi:hypothetical protein B0J13DRAFT_677102 [Dactylonectria estremocensis]|uniref:Tat pathway signal sequence domain protein n=1 Tax=Dactylonectria estremocensis TaxID=1079267 RepID=A0A9P9IZT9_9HYPO|nr:hypothetical protein B0J13DRAFT_677102 [Dactylonectria estremocensis]
MSVGKVHWLGGGRDPGALSNEVSFGMPWSKGVYKPGQPFVIEGEGQEYPLDSREIAFWADGSLKWTAHSVSSNIGYCDGYSVKGANIPKRKSGLVIDRSDKALSIKSARGLELRFTLPGSASIFDSLSLNGRCVCSGATIVASINKKEYSTQVADVKVENITSDRVVVKVSGSVVSNGEHHLPFDARVYVHSDASSLRIVHSFIHDLDSQDPLTSLGLRFSVPLRDELYNRHVRLGGSDRSILSEEVQGLSGLWFGPTVQNRIDQTAGKPVELHDDQWERNDLATALAAIPSWDAYSLSQLSSDGFTIKKRTKPGCSWVKAAAGGRADGTAYIGSARHGGLAVGAANFWERYPTQVDLADLTKEEGTVTMWLYSPLAEPLDTRPYHDGLGLDSYTKQIEALHVTYEDYEPGFATANGIGRSSELFIKPYLATPSKQELGLFSSLVRDPPRLVATPGYMHSTGVFRGCWSPNSLHLSYSPTQKELTIDSNLDLLFNYYRGQVEQHRWYGFWDHGDVQHTYDRYRHAWRYDVGGYAWDNSELSTDLWLWLYYLRTGRSDVFKMAEAMTRHTSEVDVYHAGRFKGFGTRHGVQHFSDSSKQLRISHVLFKRIYYYLTGDERTGDLIQELEQCQDALLGLDSHRKVQQHSTVPKDYAMTNIGLDCGPLAASWLTAWERRTQGWEHARDLLVKLLNGLGGLTHGIATNAILLNPKTGEIRECPAPTPEYAISHLSMLFGFPEIFTELIAYARDEYPEAVANFLRVWLSYCRAYNGGPEVQRKEFGFEFPPGPGMWRQSHSTLTAIAAVEEKSEQRGKAAWEQFFKTDGYDENLEWRVNRTAPPEYFTVGEEAPWVFTNDTARYGVSAIVNLANIREHL